MSVNRPLSRRHSPKFNTLEVISLVLSESPTTYITPVTYPVAVNQINVGLLVSPSPQASGTMVEVAPNGGVLTSPGPLASGRFGASAVLVSPTPVVTIDMSIPAVMSGALTSPAPLASGAGVVGSVASGVVVSPEPSASGWFAGGGSMVSSAPLASGAGFVGAVMDGVLVSPAPLASGTMEDLGRMTGVMVSPSPILAPTGSAWLVSPSPVAHGVMTEIIAVTYEAYAINLTTGAVTHYTNYPFDNILRFENKFYGVASNGVFELAGDLDLTVPIDAHIKTFETDFGTKNMKRLPYVYLSGRSDGGVTIGVTADEGQTYSYPSQWGERPGNTNHRTVPGKGLRGVYFSLDVSNADGGSLELDSISVPVAPTTRAV